MTNEQNPQIESGSQYDVLTDGVFLEDVRRQMLKFATMQLGDSHQAEDAVQEALIGALKNAASFGGRAALKTWIFAILKNKIADTLRQKQRSVNVSSLQRDGDEDEDFSELFDSKGFWQPEERPVAWGNPEASLREGQFWIVFEACLEGLPPKQARVFMMREFIELDADEICAEVNLTTSNLHVLLHRSRLRLRECIENKWYLEGEKNVELS
ncbi:ECF RNA polymerase sigma factor SigG [mine drainage metagenome]|uniref:ECF RNA polymerase sigma factor SigG n=1 Tax=mine drainage metagenome TaxID=410659 RepID=A0A1J5RR60_9ZZZZ